MLVLQVCDFEHPISAQLEDFFGQILGLPYTSAVLVESYPNFVHFNKAIYWQLLIDILDYLSINTC